MGTTTNYSLEYPASSDPPNGATQIQTLAEDVDTAVQTVEDSIPIVATISATTNASGEYTWNYSAAGFTATPHVVVGVRANSMPSQVVTVAAGNATSTACDVFSRGSAAGALSFYGIAVQVP